MEIVFHWRSPIIESCLQLEFNTDSVENSTSAGQEGPLDGDITLVDGSNNSQDDANNAEELIKPNKYPKRTVHNQIKKRLGKEVPLFTKP